MDLSSGIRLTQLFRDQAEHRRIDRKNICLTMLAQNGAEITVKVQSPIQTAQYLRFMLKGDHPLFLRSERQFSFGTMTDPIIFKAWGTYREPMNRMEFAVLSLRMRFLQADRPSELCFDEDFCRTDWDSPGNRVSGPTISDFIRVLEMAGNDWANMAFTTLRHRSKQHTKLSLVPKAPRN